ncbi:MAG: hypothetical protein WCX79_00690 [Candidatus Paceibacterota bacterium]|jgi:hypothetical protein
MNGDTKDTINLVIKFASVRELRSSLVVNSQDDQITGINIRFTESIKLSDFPSIQKIVDNKI